GGVVGILNDQRAHPPDAVTVPFFGRPAATSSALAKLADRTEALVIPTAAIRIAPARWRLTFEPALDVRTLPEAERGVEKLTARLNGILEQMIRRHPEQWLWLHNRWRVD
ncbi:MAG TPA: lysophospholipid acyltransferase family protein, partial [Thermoanaerobaculia bacterium]|nr:lysophospholipid acyltransferase family protein [Thermoanaerobaculia bacterium]